VLYQEVCFLLSDRGILKGKKECFWSNHNATYICGSGFKSRVWNWGSGGNI